MSHVSSFRRAGVAGASAAVVAAALAAGAVPALAKTTHKQRPRATVSPVSAPENVSANFYAGAFAVQFNATVAAGAAADQASGSFVAHLQVGSGDVGTLAGPVTCLQENGPYIGLFYPVTSSNPSALGTAIKGVYVSVEIGAHGQPLSMSFRPSEASGVSSCAPMPGLIPITGGTVTESS